MPASSQCSIFQTIIGKQNVHPTFARFLLSQNPQIIMNSKILFKAVTAGILFLVYSIAFATDPFEVNSKLGRGVNLGNALDAPTEGDWGVVLQAEYFDMIKDVGFDSIRLPVRWSAHAMTEAPYTIDPKFMERVEWAVGQALARDIPVILNLHHYREIYADPSQYHHDRLIGLWKQIALRFSKYSEDLVLELMNEPDEEFTPALWNEWLVDVLAVVRESNPDRTIMIGPGEDNIIAYLKELELPEDDQNIIVTVHNYHPLPFTHQGAEWLTWADTSKWMGNTWGNEEQLNKMLEEMDIAAMWSKQHNRPLNLGEFGAIRNADMESRGRWTKRLADAAIEHGMSFHYWEFCAYWFGVWDQEKSQYNPLILEALLPAK